jgi:hypothetical protein
MRSKEGHQTRAVEEGEQPQIDDDLFRGRSPEDVLEGPLDLSHGRAVELADQAQVRGFPRLFETQLNVAFRWHDGSSRAFRQATTKKGGGGN